MKKKNTRKKSQTNWKKIKDLKDKDIDFSDIPPLDKNFFAKAALRLPQAKSIMTIRLDPDVLDWFKAQGRGYQTRINSILRMYMESQRSHL
ncbi:MAG TPA: 3-oxoacyl-ACP synthase [Deltaproteobacteria bacterium]|nr:MAG: 3-oxoacyl-ACP synthase [Deltaproteobacteria bacterium GWA2_45_12]HBF12115.1 3-oxoacyl-ACP synthase [Deltaproteobacteria bacterium]